MPVRLLAGIVVIFTLALPGSAHAVDRFAVPTGGATTGDCTASTANPPCTLERASDVVAVSGDTVRVASGDYSGVAIEPKSGVTVQGAGPGAARPVLNGNGIGGAGTNNVTLRDLRINGEIHVETNNLTIDRVTLHTTAFGLSLNCTAGSVTIRDSEFISSDVYLGVFTTPTGACTYTLVNDLFVAQFVAVFVDAGARPNAVGNIFMGITNTIFAGALDVGPETPGSTAVTTARNSVNALQDADVIDGGGNLPGPALFVNAAGGDYHQQLTSPTRNAGTAVVGSLIDIDGQPRRRGASIDIGPSELPLLPPAVTTTPASAITTGGATLNATVNPFGLATTFHFEFGPTAAYGFSTTAQSAGSGAAAVPASVEIPGAAGATVHYRVVAQNAEGEQASPDATVALATPTATPTAEPTATAVPTVSATPAPAPTVVAKPLTRVSPALSLVASPKRARRAPYRFTLSGKLTVPAQAGSCSGRVAIRIKRGTRTLSSRTVAVKSNCSYRVTVKLSARAAGPAKLTVQASFQGNQGLLPKSAKSVSVRTG